MEKKELYSMKKHRRLLLTLGLGAMIGLMASEARAASLVLTVYAGSGTGGAVIDTFTGGSTSISLSAAQLGVLNSDIHTAGYGAYNFIGLSGTSNNPGTNGPQGGFVQLVSQLQALTTGSGAGTPITVTLTEGGFQNPASAAGNSLVNAGQASYQGNQPGMGNSNANSQGFFSDSSSPAVTASTAAFNLPSTGTVPDQHLNSDSKGLGTYVTTYTLTNVGILNLKASAGNTGTQSYTGTTSVLGVPEPSTIVMMVTAMPLPFVLMGLLRRRAKV